MSWWNRPVTNGMLVMYVLGWIIGSIIWEVIS